MGKKAAHVAEKAAEEEAKANVVVADGDEAVDRGR